MTHYRLNASFEYEEADSVFVLPCMLDDTLVTEEVPRLGIIQSLVNLSHITDEPELAHVNNLLSQYTDCFFLEEDELTGTNIIEHRIKLTDDYPINTK